MDGSPDAVDVRHVSNGSNVTVDEESVHTHTTNIYLGTSAAQRQPSEESTSTDYVYAIFPCLESPENRHRFKVVVRYVMMVIALVNITILAVYQIIYDRQVSLITNVTH